MESNRAAFSRDVAKYEDLSLQLPERRLLEMLRGRWHDLDMLDLGVGAGRTAYTFAALTRSYLGIDYVNQAIEKCRARFGENDTVKFEVGDVRDLSRWKNRRFDVVLFSFNGLDYISHEDRKRALDQVHSVLAEDGVFYFSTHSLAAYPFASRLPKPDLRDPARWAYRFAGSLKTELRLRWVNRAHEIADLRSRGWAILNDGAHNFQLDTYYVDPAYQVRQLVDAGYRVKQIVDLQGRDVNPNFPPRHPWLYYLATPAAGV